jgi:hypothetical protein
MLVHICSSTKESHMHAVPPILTTGGLPLINPWKFVDDALRVWTDLTDTFSLSILQILRSHTRKAGSVEADVAHEQFKHVQWRLYEQHLRRYDCRTDVSLRWERERFFSWSTRHSENFRHLLFLYQTDWFKRYADLMEGIPMENQPQHQSPELERLFREIESHLYQ